MKKRMHFRPSHRDKAERHIITALRSVGASVFQVNGKDIPDLLCGFRGVTTLLEVKSRLLSEEKGRAPRIRTTKISIGQREFSTRWRGGASAVVHTPHEALRQVGADVALSSGKDGFRERWLAENGAFLCEQCWLPENGLHAKDCPTRKALARPPKMGTAHRAAKKARDLLPRRRTEAMEEMHTLVPLLSAPLRPDWMAEAVREHHDELRKSRGVEGEAPTHQQRLDAAGAVDLRDNFRMVPLGGGYSRVEPVDPTKRHGRGVECELQPLPKP